MPGKRTARPARRHADQPQVFYCYTKEDRQVVDFLRSEPIHLTLVDTSADDEAYYRFLAERWKQRESFVIVEHDILPYPGAIQEIWNCEVALCGKPYQIHGGYIACFGCTKFSAELLAAYPDAIKKAGERLEPVGDPPHGGHGYKHWETLDSRILLTMSEMGWDCTDRGYWPHQHWPIVRHKHRYPGVTADSLPPPPRKPNLGVTWWL